MIKTETVEKCKECGTEKVRQLAEAPKPETITVVRYQFMDCVDFIDDQIEGGRDIIWQPACDLWGLSNDSYLNVMIDEDSFDPEEVPDEKTRDVMRLFFETFIKPHGDMETQFYVCW